ncbi:MAG: Fpg/Nei family DNA glycosylase [Gemmatimonadetes bacterium]|nr:Fpg/Nei family DNA glycosylase [Gemmatimonadota bacterium]
MPELPDVEIYLAALERRIVGAEVLSVRIRNPFVLRSVEPPVGEAAGRQVISVSRLGKRIVIGLTGDLHLVIHLMIAGRLRWYPAGKPVPARAGLVAFEFSTGTLVLTEAGSRRRASLHLVRGEAALRDMNRGGLEVLDATLAEFAAALARENHTLKRALTDPRILSGIGNAYSDEILHAARLSPMKLTRNLNEEEVGRLYHQTRATLQTWIRRLREEAGDDFPTGVTAFRKEMAVHGRFRQPCPTCGSPVQRIVYAENQVNYCPTCQTGGKLLADRAWSRLLKEDWPRSLEELEEKTASR